MAEEKYLGQWQLIPELSIYQQGEPPTSGLYCISRNEDAIAFTIAWTDEAGNPHEMSYGGPLDGLKHESDLPGVTFIKYEAVSNRILNSTAYADESVLLHATRVVSADGGLLAVSQSMPGDEGIVSNFQVYRRQPV